MHPRLAGLALFGAATTLACESAPSPAAASRLVEELRLDANAEDFSALGRVYVGPRGNVAVFLPQDAKVRIYDSTGRRLATAGGRGQGPGEFVAMAVGGWVGDSVWVYDGAERRVTYLGPDGTPVRIASVAVSTTIGKRNLEFFAPRAAFADGSLIGIGRFESTSAAGVSTASRSYYVRIDSAGGGTVVATPPAIEDDPSYMVIAGLGNRVPFLLAPTTAVSVSGDRIASLSARLTSRDEGVYSVSLLRSNGDTVFSRSYPFRGVPIPRSAIDSTLATYIPKAGAPSEGPADLPLRFQALARERMPSVYTPVQSLLLGLDNTIWLGMRPDSAGTRFVALDERGDEIGSVLIPPQSRVLQATARQMWLGVADADGLASLVRYRIVGLTAPLLPR